ncbi:MAG TPA: UTP--glucose-1-phosphate uridylyltransferase [Candidatus Hypogeohydataceae bacterium YC40]
MGSSIEKLSRISLRQLKNHAQYKSIPVYVWSGVSDKEVVEEAKESGVEQVILVTGRGKQAIENHFDTSSELERILEQKGEEKLLREIQKISNLVSFCYVRQKEALGLGHAVLCASEAVGNEPFAVLLGDMIIDSETPGLKQLMDVYEHYKDPVIGVSRVEQSEVSRYGIIKANQVSSGVHEVLDLIEKPSPEKAPSNLAIIGRYILPPEIFDILERTSPGANGEIQLTDALKKVLDNTALFACEIKGKVHDGGSKLGFLKATVELALKNPELGDDFRQYLKGLDL